MKPRVLGAAVAVAALFAVVIATQWPEAPQLLRNVYSPTFAPVPPLPSTGDAIRAWWDALRTPPGQDFLQRWVPSQSGVLWLSLLLIVLVAFDPRRLLTTRNVDLLATQLLGFLFFDIIAYLDLLRRPASVALMWWVFGGIFWVNIVLMVRATWRVTHPVPEPWAPRFSCRQLAAAALILFAIDGLAALVHEPDDAGYFINLGAQRLRERHLLPYGDPLLIGSPGGGYGPLLYVAHIPFQIALHPAPVNAVSTPYPPLGPDSTYYLPPMLATKLCTIAFQLLGVAALWSVARRYGSRELAWALVALYCGSAYVIGVGGDKYFIGGMTYVSHIAPAAVLLAAFALLHRPALAGVMLVAAAGCGFFPAFLAPAWAGYYWDRRRDLWRFAAAVGVSAIALAAFVVALSRPAEGRSRIGTILWDTFGHHTDPRGYGFSPYSFWGQHGGWQGWMMTPLVGASGFTAPAFLAFVAFAVWMFVFARRRTPQQLALITAAVVIGANLLKIHPTGTYVAWYYPFLLLGLLLPPAPERDERLLE